MAAVPGYKRKKGNGLSATKRAHLMFPVGRTRKRLHDCHFASRISSDAPVAVTAAMEYIFAELLELAGNAAIENKKSRLLSRHLMLAIRYDDALLPLFKEGTIAASGVVPYIDNRLLSRSMRGRKYNAVAAASNE